jgi:ferredoxin/flavodoxin---NADP+ reductase
MHTILAKKNLANDIISMVIVAPAIAAKAQAGQFVALMINDKGERIPLTIADWNSAKGTITIIFQKAGATTRQLAQFNPNDAIAHILGPLGHATAVERYGSVICIGGGVGIAEVWPVSRALKQAGNRIIGIIGARSADMLILQDEMKNVCDELFITTDDGSAGKKAFVTGTLKDIFTVIEQSTHTQYPDLVYAIGPVPMMEAVASITRAYNVRTIVSLNPIMVDATGMCGACRCSVNGKTVFGCVDGPDFDAHQVDFKQLNQRLRQFKDQERIAAQNQ